MRGKPLSLTMVMQMVAEGCEHLDRVVEKKTGLHKICPFPRIYLHGAQWMRKQMRSIEMLGVPSLGLGYGMWSQISYSPVVDNLKTVRISTWGTSLEGLFCNN